MIIKFIICLIIYVVSAWKSYNYFKRDGFIPDIFGRLFEGFMIFVPIFNSIIPIVDIFVTVTIYLENLHHMKKKNKNE